MHDMPKARDRAKTPTGPDAPGRLMGALDNLDQISALGVGQPVLLRPRQEMQRGVVGGYAGSGLRLLTGTRTQHLPAK